MPKPERALTVLEEERPVPWGDPGILAWHRARYEFALPFVRGKRVLDVGCGEGYGPALLAESARDLVGVDYSPEAVRHACASYPRSNLRFEVGDAAALDPRLAGFDVVTCFEVIEHLEDDEPLLSCLAASLRPGGLLILSTPNRVVDRLFESIGTRGPNEYHVNLLAPPELKRRAARHFRNVTLYGQSVRGNALHAVLKGADVLNVRHRVVRSPAVQRAIASSLMGQTDGTTAPRFRFSRLLVRQSPAVLLTGRKP